MEKKKKTEKPHQKTLEKVLHIKYFPHKKLVIVIFC